MKKINHGPSMYYASDKNIFDALNHAKVNMPTILRLFERRNIIVSKKTPKEKLAQYFSRQFHDLHDHREIAARLGVAPRREKMTSFDVVGPVSRESLAASIQSIKSDLEEAGDVLQVSWENSKVSLTIQYSTIDYRVSEIAQRQIRDGVIEIAINADGCAVRNSHNEFVNEVAERLFAKVEDSSGGGFERFNFSLQEVTSSQLRSKFFHQLALGLPGFVLKDVTAAYAFKAKPEDGGVEEDAEDEMAEPDSEHSAHIERVSLRGNGVSRSEMLRNLLNENDYYITKIVWRIRDKVKGGHEYDVEAMFSDPKNCTGFSYILAGVYPFEDGRVSSKRRSPNRVEVDMIANAVEEKAKALIQELTSEFQRGLSRG